MIYSSMRQVTDPVFDKLQIISDKIKPLYQSFVKQQSGIDYVRNVLDLAVISDSQPMWMSSNR